MSAAFSKRLGIRLATRRSQVRLAPEDRASNDADARAVNLLVDSILQECGWLRTEVLHIRSRQTQLVTLTAATTGAALSPTILPNISPEMMPVALLLGALLIAALIVNYVGNANMILVIGAYLADRLDDARIVLGRAATPTVSIPARILTWERQSQASSTAFEKADGFYAWGPASFEVIIMVTLALAGWIIGSITSLTPGQGSSAADILRWVDAGSAAGLVAWSLLGLRHNRARSRRAAAARLEPTDGV